MIVIGADTHKRSHTLAAVREATGRVLGDRTVRARRASFQEMLVWARALEGERIWAIEDCGTSRARSSGSCSHTASASCVSRRS